MLNKLEHFIREHQLVIPGERVICAVSGGADSMALLMGMYLLRDKLGIILEAAHFNHCLRGLESDADQAFVTEFCEGLQIPLHLGKKQVSAGNKGLEAAARDARYGFFEELNGKIATAHTANDNAETLIMHLIRGTGLKGLGGISPARGKIIRPMLDITRDQVLGFLEEYHVSFREDSSNGEDRFLRNRVRHHVMPLLQQENPRIAQNLSATALRLRQDEQALQSQVDACYTLRVSELRNLPQGIRLRVLERFLKEQGVKEPEAEHLEMAQSLVFSKCPSASAGFPGGVWIRRQYDELIASPPKQPPSAVQLPCPGVVMFGNYRISCCRSDEPLRSRNEFTVAVKGKLWVRSRQAGDAIRLPGGTKSLKKLFIDRKIPASARPFIPVLEDDEGIVAVGDIGANLRHQMTDVTLWRIRIDNQFKEIDRSEGEVKC